MSFRQPVYDPAGHPLMRPKIEPIDHRHRRRVDLVVPVDNAAGPATELKETRLRQRPTSLRQQVDK
jgi:hypothetical protein